MSDPTSPICFSASHHENITSALHVMMALLEDVDLKCLTYTHDDPRAGYVRIMNEVSCSHLNLALMTLD